MVAIGFPCHKPFNPESDWHLISPYNISPESNIKIMRIREMINNQRTLDCETNSPFQNLKKCMENSMENMHTDVRVLRVNLFVFVFSISCCKLLKKCKMVSMFT